MPQPIRLGILIPSSNTTLEPIAQAMVADLPNVTLHVSRFLLIANPLIDDTYVQYQIDLILAAARLLRDAYVKIIGCGDTFSGWLESEFEKSLCRQMGRTLIMRATTSRRALCSALHAFGVREMGLVSPYHDGVQEEIIRTYARMGVGCPQERHLRFSLSDNMGIEEIKESTLDEAVASVVSGGGGGVPAVTTFCTHLRAAQRVAHWEEKHGVVVFDSVAALLWNMLRLCEVDMTPLRHWGLLFTRSERPTE